MHDPINENFRKEKPCNFLKAPVFTSYTRFVSSFNTVH